MAEDLYSREFLSALPQAQPHERSSLINLNTHRPRVLQQLNKWFEELYPNGDNNLTSKLRNFDPEIFLSAFYELLIHRYFHLKGWHAQRDLELNDGNPDFYVPEIDWIAEVATLGEAEAEEKIYSEMDELCTMIEKLDSTFWISIFDFEIVRPPISKRAVIDWIREKVRANSDKEEFELVYRNTRDQTFIRFHFHKKGLNVQANVAAKGMFSMDFEGLKNRIRDRLRRKTRKYDANILIFLCSGEGFWGVHEETLNEALYGDRVMVFNKQTHHIKEKRQPNGFFTKVVGGKPLNTRVAGVVLCDRTIVSVDDDVGLRMKLNHNPHAARRISSEVFADLAQFAVTAEDERGMSMGWLNGEAQAVSLA
jgi:hypothetical protein